MLLLVCPGMLLAQKPGEKDLGMEPVVPESVIPPSPVLGVADALKSFQLASGFVIEPVAAEPLVEKPVSLDFDAKGRMWVCEMQGFMPDAHGKGESIPAGRIVILEDSDRDGMVDKRTVFLESLMLPRSVSVFEDGILFMDQSRLCWIKRDGDKPVGEPVVIDQALMQSGNVEHKPNGLLAGLDNRYYLAKSDKRIRRTAGGWELEPTAFRGQWGIARDDFGRLYHNNNSTLLFGDLLAPNLLQGNPGSKMKVQDFTQLGSNRVWPARVTPGVNRGYMSKAHGFESDTLDPKTYKLINATAAAGMAVYRGTNFPKEWYGTAFATEPVANLIKAIRIAEKDGKLVGTHPFDKSEFLTSIDERFRPVNLYNAPDGSLYILDMYHGILQHETYMTEYLRKQTLARGLDKPALGNGRIYRIRSTTGKLESVPDLAALEPLALVRMLMHPNAWHREEAQRLMVSRKDPAVIPLLVRLADGGDAVARIHAIWTLEGMGALKAEHLVSAIRSNDPKLQSSALWAVTRLGGTDLEKIGRILPDVKCSAPEVEPYLARSLGPVATPAAFARLNEMLASAAPRSFVRQAVVSGLDLHESQFIDARLADSKDKELIGWLRNAADGSGKSATRGPALTEQALASYQHGKTLFLGEAACFACHGMDGGGMPNLGPPLDGSEWVNGKPENLIRILLHGLTGPLEVAGEKYNPSADMPGLGMNPNMSDATLADIATYIRNEWSNKSTPVDAAMVKKIRELYKDRAGRSWTAQELAK